MKEVFLTNHKETIFMGRCEGNPRTEIIYPYLENKGYEVRYIRLWEDEDGKAWVDFGDWSWFFFVVEK